MSLNIVFEDDNLLILNKPAGITVNKSDTTAADDTLQDLIEKEEKIDKNSEDLEFVQRAGIVHRLDKETSGVIIVAKNAQSFRNLQAQFKERRVGKSYVALAHGEVVPDSGEISVPIGRLPWNRMRFGVIAGGREALTNYKVEKLYINPENSETLSFLKLNPKTGRTHQIRVHLKHINHPIFGDPLYGGRKTAREDRKMLQRVFLHAKEISFFDPGTNEPLNFDSPLPSELNELLDKLQLKNNN